MKAFTAIFDILPGWVYAAAIAALLVLMGGQQLRIGSLKVDVAEGKTELANYKTTAAESARLAERGERAEEQRRRLAQGKALNEAHLNTMAAQADAAGYRDSSRRLQKRLDSFAAASRAVRADTATASSSETAGDPIGVLAHVLGRCERRIGLLAAYADSARIAGKACEAQYDALVTPDYSVDGFR